MVDPARTFEQLVGMVKESDFNTPGNPLIGFPITGGGGKPVFDEIYDNGRRGIASNDFAAYQGAGHSEFAVDGIAYPVEIGYMLAGIFGGEAISGAGDPYTHTFSQSANVPSYTIEETVLGGSNGAMRFAGSKFATLGLSYESGSGVFAYTSTLQGKIPTKVTPQSLTVAPLAAWPGWRANVSSTGKTGRITKAAVNLTRELDIIHVSDGTQGPKYINVGPLSVEGTFSTVVTDLTDFDDYLADLTQAFTIAFTYGSPARSFSLVITSANMSNAPMEFDAGGVSRMANLAFRGLYNVTDTGSAKATLLNSRATVY